MPGPTTLAAFAVAAALLVLLPGPSMLFLVARGIAGGPRVGAWSALGVNTATAVFVAATATGLTALVAASGTALAVIRTLGAAYLVLLGIRTLRDRSRAEDAGPPPGVSAAGRLASWRAGFLVGISNPKVVLFFVAFFPQFLDPSRPVAPQVLALGAVLVLIGCGLDLCYGLFGGAVHRALARRSAGLRRGRIAVGLTYIGLGGLTLATGSRAA